jgi:hypothetical protein
MANLNIMVISNDILILENVCTAVITVVFL